MIADDFIEGISEVLAEFGAAGTIKHKERTPDPTNPTRTITVETTYNATLFFSNPRDVYVGGGVRQTRQAKLYVDLSTMTDELGDPVSYLPVNGDQATLPDGTILTMVTDLTPQVNGQPIVSIHEVTR